ncbi:MAG: nucleotide pyrophosphohydrolase [Firmicutes bacterium]|nr:nucleotide pyrophosphohydrolase [Bacillota bacterium]
MIKIVGLGPGAREAVTLGAYEELKSAEKIFLRTEIHPTVEYLREWGIKFETYDEKYESLDSFDDIYENIALDLIKQHEEFKDIVYAVPGHPQVAEKTVSLLLGLCEEKKIEYKILPAVSFIDALIDALQIDPVGGLKIVDAFDLDSQIMDRRCGTVVTQVYDKYIASEVKLKLMEYYKDDCVIYFVRAAGIEGQESVRRIRLFELDRQSDIDYLTSIYIPKDTESVKDFTDLLAVMDTLREEGGCPWDREQTHESLRKYLVEESYEVIEAIDEGDYSMLSEELGDVLFQVVFHARIGKENEAFNMTDVINTICLKMISRHPHVFAKAVADTSDEVLVNWDKIKRKEQGLKSHTDELKHVAKSLPSLIRAEKVQKKAAKAGFDWDSVEGALDKVLEEYHEIKEACKEGGKEKTSEEVGDLLFAAVNVARFLDIDPEYALHFTIEKFIGRFKYIEDQAVSKGYTLSEMTLEEMDVLWNEAKTKKNG